MARWLLRLLFVGLISSLVSTNAATTSGEADKLWESVFASGGPELEPSETLRLLNRLDDIYDKPGLKNDVKSFEIEKLIRVSQVAYNKCAARSFKPIALLIDTYSGDQRNVQNYLNHYRDAQFNYCAGTFNDELNDSLSQLRTSDMENMLFLRESVLDEGRIDEPLHKIPENLLLEGLVSFMATRTDVIPLARNEPAFDSEYEKLVGGLCGVISTIAPTIDLSDMLYDDPKLMHYVDENTVEWLINFRICRTVADPSNSIKAKLFDLMSKRMFPRVEKKPPRKMMKKLKSIFQKTK